VIVGIVDPARGGAELEREVRRAAGPVGSARNASGPAGCVWSADHVALGCFPRDRLGAGDVFGPLVNEAGSVVTAFTGRLFNGPAVRRGLATRHEFRTGRPEESIVHLYEDAPDRFLLELNGQFALALWDASRRTIFLARDRLGVEPLFYHQDGERVVFASSLDALLRTGGVTREVDPAAVAQYLLYCYNPGADTIIRGVRRLPAGYVLTSARGRPTLERYWYLSYAATDTRSEKETGEAILELLEDAVRLRVEPDRRAGVFLSGGTDSSAIVSLSSRMSEKPLHTFSFRCAGASYDESRYARFVAERYRTEHMEVQYGPDRLALVDDAVRWMDEPFCDLGIELATYLLGQSASGQVDYVMSGEGGDELFAGHPVYHADRVAAVADLVPAPLFAPLARMLQRLPDSDAKKDLRVKLKRFAYGLTFPPDLLSHRWRAYYTRDELAGAFTPEFLDRIDVEKVFDPILRHNQEADGRDRLSRSLYSDYRTLVDFYFRRVGLLRAFPLEIRLPLMDHRLVDLSARIPSGLKIRGLSTTKYVYRRALEGVVPREILYGRPKLGHGVPLKNWLRHEPAVQAWVNDRLTCATFRERGIVRPEAVRRMLDEHATRAHNHSHRLWGLVVLDAWLRTHVDAAA